VPALVAATLTGGVAVAAQPEERGRLAEPLVIGHRGASGYRPEHTLAAYRLAIRMGADYVEPDLVSTKDGVLVARHENEISGTTDVADRPELADRRTAKVIDGRPVTGWFTEDFTLAELKTLRARERLPGLRPGNARYDGRFEVPTFDEVLALARSEGAKRGRPVGVYPETKHPTYFDSVGLPLEEPLVACLRRHGLDSRRSPVFVQSFEVGTLRELGRLTDVRLVQLLDATGGPYDRPGTSYAGMATSAGLREIATYADGAGPAKSWIIPRDPDGHLGETTTFVRDAHRVGLLVHTWTMRSENAFLPADYRAGDDAAAHGDAEKEYRVFYDQGVDGVFSDHPDDAVAARDPADARQAA
jgi:glycerophosphoryl diester phosphodiesterase